jgi:hypothetical protein
VRLVGLQKGSKSGLFEFEQARRQRTGAGGGLHLQAKRERLSQCLHLIALPKAPVVSFRTSRYVAVRGFLNVGRQLKEAATRA